MCPPPHADPPAPHAHGGECTADAAPHAGAPLRPFALLLAYDGSAFQGWQAQPRGPSVQGRLEEALRVATRVAATVYGSGRTDAGVHALNQVAHVRLPGDVDPHKLRASLNGLLGPAISVKALVPVGEHFHARHSARGKHYRYRLFNRPYPPAFSREHCWWLRQPLDVPAMNAAAALLLGEHDFSAFRARHCEAPSPVRTLLRLEALPCDAPDCTLAIELEATGFLQHMARILVGTLVDVGQGKLSPAQAGAILSERRREAASATAPPGGLHLVSVEYDLSAHPELRAFADA